MHVMDPEITAMLETLQETEKKWDARVLLAFYRAEALAAARSCLERERKEAMIDDAHDRLKESLRTLLRQV